MKMTFGDYKRVCEFLDQKMLAMCLPIKKRLLDDVSKDDVDLAAYDRAVSPILYEAVRLKEEAYARFKTSRSALPE